MSCVLDRLVRLFAGRGGSDLYPCSAWLTIRASGLQNRALDGTRPQQPEGGSNLGGSLTAGYVAAHALPLPSVCGVGRYLAPVAKDRYRPSQAALSGGPAKGSDRRSGSETSLLMTAPIECFDKGIGVS